MVKRFRVKVVVVVVVKDCSLDDSKTNDSLRMAIDLYIQCLDHWSTDLLVEAKAMICSTINIMHKNWSNWHCILTSVAAGVILDIVVLETACLSCSLKKTLLVGDFLLCVRQCALKLSERLKVFPQPGY